MSDDSDITWEKFLSEDWDDEQKELFLELLKIYNQKILEKRSEQLERTDSEFMIYQDDVGSFAIKRLLQDIAADTESAPKASDPLNLDIYRNSDSYRHAHYEIVQSITNASTDRADCILPTTGRLYFDVINRLLEDRTSLQLIFMRKPFKIIQNENITPPSTPSQSAYEWLSSVIDHQDADVYVSSSEINIELFILDDTVCVGTYSSIEGEEITSGAHFTSLIGTDLQFYNWATDVFSHIYTSAIQVSDIDEPVK